MLELRPNCEHCNRALPPASTSAMICSYECTFCRDCVVDVLDDVCPNCGGAGLDWVDAGGGGTVYSATVVRRKAQHGGDYSVVLVDLDEGPRMMSRVEGIAPDAVRIGMRVRARIAAGEGGHFVVFDPQEAA